MPGQSPDFAKRAPVYTLLHDSPLIDVEELKAESFGLQAKMGAVYDAIRHPDMRTPFTVMVSGGWGTGKSSSMRWLEHQLKAWYGIAAKDKKLVKVDTAWFYPWKYQEKEDVWRGLIATVILASIDLEHVDTSKVIKAAKQFGSFLGLGFIRAVGALKVKFGDAKLGGELALDGKELSGIIEEWGKHITPHKAYFNDFEHALESWVKESYKGNHRLCIFIDDLDRCLPDIALQVLEALKLYLNVPNLVFVIGVDKDVINKIVAKRYEDMVGTAAMGGPESNPMIFGHKAEQYLEKMFQVEVDIVPDEEQIGSFLESQLAKSSVWNELGHHQPVFHRLILREAKNNPRAVVRNVNTVFQGAARVRFADDPSVLSAAQALQQVYLRIICGRCNRGDVPLTMRGQQFLRAWSNLLTNNSDPYYLRRQDYTRFVLGISSGDEYTVAKAKRENNADQVALDLVQLAKDFPDCGELLVEESLGLLLTVPYPQEVSVNMTSALMQSGSAQAKALLDDRSRVLFASALGIAPEDVTEVRLLEVTSLDFAHERRADDEVMRQLILCPNLVMLYADDTSVTDEGIEHLSSLAQLTTLVLMDNEITDRGVEFLLSLKQLEYLDLDRTRITDASLVILSQLPNLGTLYVSDVPLSDLSPLTGMGLHRLYVNSPHVDDRAIGVLNSMLNLRHLSVPFTSITDDGLARLRLPRLESLVVSSAPSANPLTDAAFSNAETWQELKELTVYSADISLETIEKLSRLEKLQKLNLKWCNVGDAIVSSLIGMKSLKQVALTGTRISDLKINELKQARKDLVVDLSGPGGSPE
jgi:Leucine-rich repeat (LRR) protein